MSSTVPPAAAAPVIRTAWVQRSPAEAFSIFTDEIGAWWPLPSHGLFGSEAGGLIFQDDKLVEYATDGREKIWGEVVSWEPPGRLVITWHPGRDEDEASRVAVTFEADRGGTRVIIEHDGWETFGQDAMERRRTYAGPNAWGYVLDHYCDATEPHVQPLDLSGLEAAYEAFFAEAERDGFSPPTDGGWDADQVLAHVALNDAAMVAVCQGLVHGNPTRFENIVCQDHAALASWIEAAGDRGGLIERGRSAARQVQAALRRLSPKQLDTPVDCHLLHDGEVMVDAPRPWQAVAVHVQAGVHLPAHVEQLAKLRPA